MLEALKNRFNSSGSVPINQVDEETRAAQFASVLRAGVIAGASTTTQQGIQAVAQAVQVGAAAKKAEDDKKDDDADASSDDDDDDKDEDDEKKKEKKAKKKGAAAERIRIEAILTHPLACLAPQSAKMMAFKSGMSAEMAICMLSVSAEKAAPKQHASGLRDRMATVPNPAVTNNGTEDQPNMADEIVAIYNKVRVK